LLHLATVVIAHASSGTFSHPLVAVSAVPNSMKSNLVYKTKLYPDLVCHLQTSFNPVGIKLFVVIIGSYHCYWLRTKFHPTFLCQGQLHM